MALYNLRRATVNFSPIFFTKSRQLIRTKKSSDINTSLYRITRQVSNLLMQTTEKKIKIIRDKLNRIGIGETCLDNETILASYSINEYGNLCAVPRVSSNPSGFH